MLTLVAIPAPSRCSTDELLPDAQRPAVRLRQIESGWQVTNIAAGHHTVRASYPAARALADRIVRLMVTR